MPAINATLQEEVVVPISDAPIEEVLIPNQAEPPKPGSRRERKARSRPEDELPQDNPDTIGEGDLILREPASEASEGEDDRADPILADAQDEAEEDEDGEPDELQGEKIEITNPFATTFEFIQGIIRRWRASRPEKPAEALPPDEEEEGVDDYDEAFDEDDVEMPAPFARYHQRYLPFARTKQRREYGVVYDDKDDGYDEHDEDDEQIRPSRTTRATQHAYMRPDSKQQPGGDRKSRPAKEDTSMKANLPRPELTEKLIGDLNSDDRPLTRRERKALTSGDAAPKKPRAAADELPKAVIKEPEVADEVEAPFDGPTRQFKPIRVQQEPLQGVRSRRGVEESLQEDDDEDDDGDVRPPKKFGFGQPKARAKKLVYADDDYDEYDDDDDDEYDDDDYDDDDDDYYDDDDYDDEYDDDYDEEYDDDYDEEYELAEYARKHHESGGKRILKLLKTLLVLGIVLLILVVTVRQLEAGKIINLDGLRRVLGPMMPIDAIFPPAHSDLPILEDQLLEGGDFGETRYDSSEDPDGFGEDSDEFMEDEELDAGENRSLDLSETDDLFGDVDSDSEVNDASDALDEESSVPDPGPVGNPIEESEEEPALPQTPDRIVGFHWQRA